MPGHLEGFRSENPVPAHASFLILIFAEEDVGLRDVPHNPAAFAAVEVLFPGFLRSQAVSLAQLQKRVHDFHITLPSVMFFTSHKPACSAFAVGAYETSTISRTQPRDVDACA